MSNEVGSVAAQRQTDCHALDVGTKVVIQPVWGHTHIRAVAACRQRIRGDAVCVSEVLSGPLTDACKHRQRPSNVGGGVQNVGGGVQTRGTISKPSIAIFQYSILDHAVNRDQLQLMTFERHEPRSTVADNKVVDGVPYTQCIRCK